MFDIRIPIFASICCDRKSNGSSNSRDSAKDIDWFALVGFEYASLEYEEGRGSSLEYEEGSGSSLEYEKGRGSSLEETLLSFQPEEEMRQHQADLHKWQTLTKLDKG